MHRYERPTAAIESILPRHRRLSFLQIKINSFIHSLATNNYFNSVRKKKKQTHKEVRSIFHIPVWFLVFKLCFFTLLIKPNQHINIYNNHTANPSFRVLDNQRLNTNSPQLPQLLLPPSSSNRSCPVAVYPIPAPPADPLLCSHAGCNIHPSYPSICSALRR